MTAQVNLDVEGTALKNKEDKINEGRASIKERTPQHLTTGNI